VCKKSLLLSDPSSVTDTCINDAVIFGIRMVGCGHGAMEELFACLGMLPLLTRKMWTTHKRLLETSTTVAKQCCIEAARLSCEKQGKPPTEVIAVIVTVDGTWQKWGCTSFYRVVVVISWQTGQVLDAEVLSKHCGACKMKA